MANDLNKPLTRIEEYLSKAAGLTDTAPDIPLTRIEEYLKIIADGAGAGGGGGDEDIPCTIEPNATYFTVDSESRAFVRGGILYFKCQFTPKVTASSGTYSVGHIILPDGWINSISLLQIPYRYSESVSSGLASTCAVISSNPSTVYFTATNFTINNIATYKFRIFGAIPLEESA